MTQEEAEELAVRMNAKAPAGVSYEVAVTQQGSLLDFGEERGVDPFYVRRVVDRSERAVELPVADSGHEQ